MKKKAQQNESVFDKQIWNIEFQQICAPILHIILGITKKIFDVMISEVQDVDNTCPEQKI